MSFLVRSVCTLASVRKMSELEASIGGYEPDEGAAAVNSEAIEHTLFYIDTEVMHRYYDRYRNTS